LTFLLELGFAGVGGENTLLTLSGGHGIEHLSDLLSKSQVYLSAVDFLIPGFSQNSEAFDLSLFGLAGGVDQFEFNQTDLQASGPEVVEDDGVGLVVLSFQGIIESSSGILRNETNGVKASDFKSVTQSDSLLKSPPGRNSDNDVLHLSVGLVVGKLLDIFKHHSNQFFDTKSILIFIIMTQLESVETKVDSASLAFLPFVIFPVLLGLFGKLCVVKVLTEVLLEVYESCLVVFTSLCEGGPLVDSFAVGEGNG